MLARMNLRSLPFVLGALLLAPAYACKPQKAATAPCPAPSPTVAEAPPPEKPEKPEMSAPIDENAVATATGSPEKAEKSPDGAVKVSFPRKDIEVLVDGWKMPPFMGLTTWVAFTPAKKDVAEAMIMGDLVLFEDEVNPVMSKLLDGGVQVTALHNHFFFEQPKVYFMHVGGEGPTIELAFTIKRALDEVAAIRKKTPKPTNTFGTKLPTKNAIDGAKLDAVLATKGTAQDGMYKAVWGRSVTTACGCTAGKSMGVNTWAAFAGEPDNAIVDGDFAVLETELQTVLKTLRAGGINVVAIHHHMTTEKPRILFLHYWGRGRAEDLAGVVKKAVDQTKVVKPKPATT
jgi:hypothetical protein